MFLLSDAENIGVIGVVTRERPEAVGTEELSSSSI
jgi:hypothetical protein